jgi:GPI-anchor transamidase subunit K
MFDPANIKSHPGLRTDLFPYNLSETLITDFFGGVSKVEISDPESDVQHLPSMEAWEESQSTVNSHLSASNNNQSKAASGSHRLATKAARSDVSGIWSLLGILAVGVGAWRLQRRSPQVGIKEKMS